MDFDFLYSCVIDSSWVFLTGWLLLLLGATVQVFRVSRPAPPNPSQR